MRLCLSWLFFATVAIFHTTAVRAEALAEVLAQTGKAYREQSYQGVLTFEYGGSIQSLAALHGVYNDQEFEKLSSLNGNAFERVRLGHHLSCIHPGDQRLRYGQTLPITKVSSAGSELNLEDAHYQLAYRGKYRIADRPVDRVVMKPLDMHRNGYEFYIDQESHIVLKRLVISPEGKILERMQFVNIDFIDSETVASLASGIPLDAPAHESIDTANAPSEISRWLPDGFVLAATTNRDNATMWTYSDGLASFSIILEPVTRSTQLLQVDGRARRGATVAYTKPLILAEEHKVLTVLGEIPILTAAKVAHNVRIELIPS